MKKTIRNSFFATLLGVSTFAASPAVAEEVYMIRGFLNVFSDGMNQMTKRLKRQGIRAKAISNGNWDKLADDIIRRSRANKVSYPIIIVGHSLGGVEAASFANKLGSAGVRTDLLIGLDPGFPKPPALRKGAVQVINYKIPSGQFYRKGAGFKGRITNIDVSKYGTDHVGIDKNRSVQNLVIGKIREKVKK